MPARRTSRLVFAWKAFCYGLGLLVAGFLAVQLWFLGHIVYWKFAEPASTAFMERRLEELRARNPRATLRREWAPYSRISLHLKRAVVAAEDAKFLDHEGFDWEMIHQAMAKNQSKGRVVAGASTISQQLAKNLFLSGQRSWMRKAQEAIITWMLEAMLSKQRILELYLNCAEWGEGVFGAEAAARYHFNARAATLDAGQAAYLAAILPSPRRYGAGRTTPYIEGRAVTILARMEGAQVP